MVCYGLAGDWLVAGDSEARLTNAFSKRWGNLGAAYSLWFAFYRFCRVHKTLRVTPAMEQGIADHELTIMELIA
jgi:hypothetical protein